MNELFGVSMNLIAGVAFAATAGIFVVLAWLAFRNPVMFKNGLRNIPRRKTQTALIIFGLMLATVIITAAFGTGDTVNSTGSEDVFRTAQEVDEYIRWNAEDFPRPEEQQTIDLRDVRALAETIDGEDGVQGLLPVILEVLPVVNGGTRLNESAAHLIAYDTARAEPFGGLRDTDGDDVSLSGPAIAINESLVEALDAHVGDTLLIFFEGAPVPVEVVAIVPDTILGGAASTLTAGFPANDDPGGAVDIAFFSDLLGRADADYVLVTNEGDARGGVGQTDDAVKTLETALVGTKYEVVPMKRGLPDLAALFGSVFTTIFVIFGLFSIAAGILLIFLIFIMLAAERKPEMGMARAVGAKRRHLVESFLAEGMGYDLGSAVVGVVLGIVVTYAMVGVVNQFAEEGLGIVLRVSFTVRSIFVSFCLGVIATFLVITVASVRASRLNIVAAIRDLPEPRHINPEAATALGFLRGTLNAFVAAGYLGVAGILLFFGPIGALLALPALLAGLVGPFVYVLRGSTFSARDEERAEGERIPLWPFFVAPGISTVAYAIALVLVRVTRNRRPRTVPRWVVVACIFVPPAAVVLAALQERDRVIAWAAGFGVVAAVAGALSIALAYRLDLAFFFMAGVSLLFLTVALTLRYYHVAERMTFTLTSTLVLATWYATPAGALDWLTGGEDMTGGIEVFFLSGIVMIAAGTFIIVYNADVVLPLVAAYGERLGRVVPAVKTAVAYPLVSRMRTGLTIAMIGLIMFALIVFATLNENFTAVFLGDQAKGGFDVRAIVNPNNPVDDMYSALEAVDVDTSALEYVAETRVAYPFETEIRDPYATAEDDEFGSYLVIGGDETFLTANTLELQRRAAGFGSDEEVWRAIAEGENLAVINAALTAQQDGFGGGPLELLRIPEIDLEPGFEPFTLDLRDPGTLRITTVTVIGQMDDPADVFWPGIVVNDTTLGLAFPDARGQTFYFVLGDGGGATEFAKSVEAALVQASADSLEEILDDQRAASSGFLLLFQGFMGLGLIVGIAALGVISFRAVVERRQQIGMLRAIGYQRSMVALSFLFESSFVALSGILLGLVLGLSFSWMLFTSGSVGEEAEGAPFIVPWAALVILCVTAFGASLLMTIIPARSASRVAVAEALRYE